MRRTKQMPVGFDPTSLDNLAGAVRFGFREFGMELETVVNGLAVYSDAPSARPGEERLALAPDFTPAKLGDLAVQQCKLGKALVGWKNGAYAATPLPFAVELRDVFAEHLGVSKTPWDVEVQVRWHESGRIDRVELVRLPRVASTADARMNVWRELVARIPGADEGWTVTEDAIGGNSVTLSYGEKLVLPTTVPLADILPDRYMPEGWMDLPFGKDPKQRLAGMNLKLGPHALAAGPTGTGKTIALTANAASRLTRGHKLIIVDPSKGVDFLRLEEYCIAFCKTYEESLAAVEWVLAEGARRKAIMMASGEVNWFDLSPELRAQEDIVPLTVMADEVTSLFAPIEVPKELDSKHPKRVAAQNRQTQKTLIRIGIGEIARELRYTGIFLLLAMQQANVGDLGGGEAKGGGALRANLSSTIGLMKPGADPDFESVKMLFKGGANRVMELREQLDDGRSLGLAFAAGEDEGLTAIRVAYALMKEVPALLAARGVPKPVKLNLGGPPAVSVSPPVAYAPIIGDDDAPPAY